MCNGMMVTDAHPVAILCEVRLDIHKLCVPQLRVLYGSQKKEQLLFPGKVLTKEYTKISEVTAKIVNGS
jgi:hypothetical protein